MKIGICSCYSSWTSHFFPTHERDGILTFFNISFNQYNLALLQNLYQFTRELENWNFWILLTFIYCLIVRIVFQAWYLCRRGADNLWLNCQFLRKCSYLCKKIMSVQVLGILFASLNEGKNCKTLPGILMQMLTNS